MVAGPLDVISALSLKLVLLARYDIKQPIEFLSPQIDFTFSTK
jgi:hypothetical protein